MKDKNKGKEVPAKMFMMLAEDAHIVNAFGALGPGGQQIFMEKFSHARSEEEEQKLIRELTK